MANVCNLGARRCSARQHLAATEGHSLASQGTLPSSLPASVAPHCRCLAGLPPHIREAILTLVDAAMISVNSAEVCRSENGGSVDELAWQVARRWPECRSGLPSRAGMERRG